MSLLKISLLANLEALVPRRILIELLHRVVLDDVNLSSLFATEVKRKVQEHIGVVTVQQELGVRQTYNSNEAIVASQKVMGEELCVPSAPRVQALVIDVEHLDEVAVVRHHHLLELRTHLHAKSHRVRRRGCWKDTEDAGYWLLHLEQHHSVVNKVDRKNLGLLVEVSPAEDFIVLPDLVVMEVYLQQLRQVCQQGKLKGLQVQLEQVQ